jgi:predicted Zn-dependent protease with MMP-like domain
MNTRTFERYVERALEELPDRFREALTNLEIVVEDFPDPRLLDELGLEPPLLGLYVGTPLPERSLADVDLPDRIVIYRGEILRLGVTGKELVEEIRLTVLHEIGHYFGLDDDTLEEMGY